MVAKRDLQGLSAKELDDMLISLDKDMQKIRQDKQRVSEVYNQKFAEEEAERIFDGLPEAHKRALAQHVAANGIPSEEEVNGV